MVAEKGGSLNHIARRMAQQNVYTHDKFRAISAEKRMTLDLNRYELPEEETSKRARKLGKFLLALVVNWKTTLLLVALIWVAWRERFWRHPVMWFTVPLVSLLLILPILDYYGYSFVPLLRRKFRLWRHNRGV